MEKLAIWGASGHAKVVADVARLLGEFELLGFLDSVNPARKGEAFAGSVVLGGEECLPGLLKQGARLVFGFGAGAARLELAARLQSQGFLFPRLIHPRAIVAASAAVGAGTVVAAGAVINSDARIGNHVIINTAASVDHDCVIADGATIAPGVHLAGYVQIGQVSMIGIGSVARDRARVGKHCLVGAGSVVVSDLPDGVLAYGVPAKVVRPLHPA